jgi:hypothetical protein
MKRQNKTGFFDYDSMTVKFGGKNSKPENIFDCTAIKVPDYTYTVMEQEDAGGGCYYQTKVPVEYKETNTYVIIKGGVCIGQMFPYAKEHNLQKTTLVKCNSHALKLLKDKNIRYEPDYTY